MEITSWQELGKVPVTILQLKGDLTSNEPLESRAKAVFQDGARNLVLDLGQVPYISSAGLRAIHIIYSMLKGADPEDEKAAVRDIVQGRYKSPHLKLVNPTKNAMKALSTAGYDMFLEVHDDVPAAVHSFG
ncbi:MAG TPA: STAS domain-containing protein [Promineifilum sp.]